MPQRRLLLPVLGLLVVLSAGTRGGRVEEEKDPIDR
jgi:hypothetical protein